MIQISKDQVVGYSHVAMAMESREGVGILTLSNGEHAFVTEDYWPQVKAQLWPIDTKEYETLAALRELDTFALKYNISADMKTLVIPEGKTVSEVLIALAQALRENAISPSEE